MKVLKKVFLAVSVILLMAFGMSIHSYAKTPTTQKSFANSETAASRTTYAFTGMQRGVTLSNGDTYLCYLLMDTSVSEMQYSTCKAGSESITHFAVVQTSVIDRYLNYGLALPTSVPGYVFKKADSFYNSYGEETNYSSSLKSFILADESKFRTEIGKTQIILDRTTTIYTYRGDVQNGLVVNYVCGNNVCAQAIERSNTSSFIKNGILSKTFDNSTIYKNKISFVSGSSFFNEYNKIMFFVDGDGVITYVIVSIDSNGQSKDGNYFIESISTSSGIEMGYTKMSFSDIWASAMPTEFLSVYTNLDFYSVANTGSKGTDKVFFKASGISFIY